VSGYWARRTGSALLVLGLVLVLNFVLFRMMPGDPVASIIAPNFSPEAKARLSEVYGLDQSLPVQFLRYVRSTLTFDFGRSFRTGRPVMEELKSRLPNTVGLLGTSLVLSFSFPSFFVQLVLLMAFAAALPLFPLRGTLSVPPPAGGLPLLIDYLWHMALPVFSLVLLGFGGWALYVRNLMVKILGEDFILLARARGLPERNIILGHAFRTLLPPLLTIFLLSLPGIVSGAVITETVFSLHGVGRFLLEAVTGHDYPAAGASFFLLALLTVSCNLLSDLLYGLTDPRVRMERGGGR
jgi:peptide/nickel transport system permease protein